MKTHSFFFRAAIMLALVLACSMSAAGLRAQVAYNFQHPDEVAVPFHYYTTPVGWDVLTMDCLAANGYGQWTSSSSTTNANGAPSCFLLANKLQHMPNDSGNPIWDDAQTGVLASKKFTFIGTDSYPTADAIKNAANLQGNVRWVWLNNARNAFYIEGFDPGSRGIDISFSSLNAPTSDPSIVKASNALGSTYPLTTGHTVVSSSAEGSPLDRFDIAMDASYTYIVWEEATTSHGVLSYSIWAMVVKLSDGSIALAPTRVDPLGGLGGVRPTIAVDVRNSGSITPFDIVYIDPGIPNNFGNVWWTQYNGTGFNPPLIIPHTYGVNGGGNWEAPLHARILVASEASQTPSTLNQRAVYIIAGTSCLRGGTRCKQHLFLDYIYSGSPFTPCEYCDGLFNNTRPPGCPVRSASPHDPSQLYFFQVIDNPIIAFANPYEGYNSNAPLNDAVDFTEFHCLYQLLRSGYDIGEYGTPAANSPLMIIPGSNVASGYCVNGNGPGAFYDDPGTNPIGFAAYCGAVNQMGIHVHWTDGNGDHYYRRDIREFDQDIEENTLLTDSCDVGNSRSQVGTSSPTVHSNLYFTLYADPNNSVCEALVNASPYHAEITDLNFEDGATLNIGSSSYSKADFVIVGSPYNTSNWGLEPGNPSVSSNSWTVTFGPDNSLDDYDYGSPSFYGNGQFTLTGSGETMDWTTRRDSLSSEYVSHIAHPAKWTFYGSGQITLNDLDNTDFVLLPQDQGDNINIAATDGIFDFRGLFTSETIGQETYNHVSSGYLTTYGNGSYTNCQFLTDPASSGEIGDYCMAVCGNGTWDGTHGTGDGNYDYSINHDENPSPECHTVTFTNCYFTTGLNLGGTAYYGTGSQELMSPPIVDVEGGLFDGIETPYYYDLTGRDPGVLLYSGLGIVSGVSNASVNQVPLPVAPWWPITVNGATFRNMLGNGILIDLANNAATVLEPDGLKHQLYGINITWNDFENYVNYNFFEYSVIIDLFYGPAGITLANAPDLLAGTNPSPEENAIRWDIFVQGNYFESGSEDIFDVQTNSYVPAGSETPGFIPAAIHFINATGTIEENEITPNWTGRDVGSKYQNGIWNESSTAYISPNMTWSYICSNIVSGAALGPVANVTVPSAGLTTDYYFGYSKLNNFSYNNFGQFSGSYDNGHIDGATYNNNAYGYEGISNSVTDLTGIHHPTDHSLDEVGGNTITGGGLPILLNGDINGNESATVYLGKAPIPLPWPSTSPYGFNDIETTGGGIDIQAEYPNLNLGDISNNYWGGGSYVLGNVTASGGYLPNPLWLLLPPSDMYCGTGDLLTKPKGPVPLSIPPDTSFSDTSCGWYFSLGYSYATNGIEPQGYDTLRAFIEQCPFWTDSVNYSWNAFSLIGGAAEGWIALGDGTWPEFLSLLKQVLWLNPDPNWYCNDVGDMITAVQDQGAAEAICRYVVENNKCPGMTAYFDTVYKYQSLGRHLMWQEAIQNKYEYLDSPPSAFGVQKMDDSIKADTLANPYDTAVPTLWQDSLEVLIGPDASVQPASPMTSQALLSAKLLENPVSDGEIGVSFQMGRTALVTMELRDVLGRMVPLTYAKYQLEQPGQHNATIPAPTLPAGTYYLRITTDTGDAITLKIVKE